MKIKRFNEELEPIEMDSQRVKEIIEELEDFLAIVNDKQTRTESIINELTKYKNPSKKGNDQIDDTIISLQVVKKSLDEAIDKLDTSIQNMNSYIEDDRKYLYSENK